MVSVLTDVDMLLICDMLNMCTIVLFITDILLLVVVVVVDRVDLILDDMDGSVIKIVPS